MSKAAPMFRKGDLVSHYLTGGLFVVSSCYLSGSEFIVACLPINPPAYKRPPKFAHGLSLYFSQDVMTKVVGCDVQEG